MKPDSAAIRAVRWGLVGLGIALPALTLVPLGSYWLWERGWLIYWAIFACIATVIAWFVQWRLLRPTSARLAEQSDPSGIAPVSPGDPAWTPAEERAWVRVGEIVRGLDPATIQTRSDAVDLGQRTIETVALALHPERTDPLLQFTAPEALSLVERVAVRMNTFIRESVPLGDKLTIAQMRALYEWRGSMELAEQAWSVWRVIRMLNPASALANEVRERVGKELMTWGKTHIARRLATVYVEEVGRAAIDLYGGRLRLSRGQLEAHVSSSSRADIEAAEIPLSEPLRALVIGQVSAGKSSLVNALGAEVRAAVDALPATSRFTPYRLERDGMPAALIVDSPGLEAGVGTAKEIGTAFLDEAIRSDLILWVAAAHRADREIDRQALAALRQEFAARPERRAPPVLLVLTHIDRLRPFQEWSPPYDLAAASSPKAQSIRAAVEAAAHDFGIATGDVVPCSLAIDREFYNIDAVWAAIVERLPDAQRARLVRALRDAEGKWDVGRIWQQVLSGGRVVAGKLRG